MLRRNVWLRITPRELQARRARAKEFVLKRRAEIKEIEREREHIAPEIDGIDRTIIVEGLATPVQLSLSRSVSGESLFANSRVLRENRYARDALKACVVGGSAAIHRIWRTYGVRPRCVYAPDDVDLPEWCFGDANPTVIIRTDPSDINGSLLASNQTDGFAAEFDLPPMPSLLDLTTPTAVEEGDAAAPAAAPALHLHRVVVLHRTSNASNVGMILRSCAEMGFDAAILDRSADCFNEKVLRGSLGAPFAPHLRTYRMNDRSGGADPTAVLQQAAIVHRLLPIFAVPDPSAESVFKVAQRLHYHNRDKSDEAPDRLGAMIVLGSESTGLADLEAEWNIPAKLASIPMDNPLVESMNVAFAASIMMQHFRPNAAAEFKDLFARGVVPTDGNEELTEMLRLTEGTRAVE